MTLLWDLALIFAFAIIVSYLCHLLKVPIVAGFLVTGIISGPAGLGLIKDIHSIEEISELGVMLLLFTIGLEFSIRELFRFKRLILGGGALYMLLTFIVGTIVYPYMMEDKGLVKFISMLTTLSSTAVALKLLQDKAAVESPQGRISFSILLFQDLAFVPLIVALPLISGSQEALKSGAFYALSIKSGLLLLTAFLGSRWIVPTLMNIVAKTKMRELFLLTILFVFLATTWLAHSLGLSLALGAFIAGLMLAGTEYSHQALADFLPFKDIFTSIFFVSIGMLVDLNSILSNISVLMILTGTVILIKIIVGTIVAVSIDYPIRVAILASVYLCQIGEFSFMLTKVGLGLNIIGPSQYNLILSLTVSTVILSPFIIMISEAVLSFVDRYKLIDNLLSLSVRGKKSGYGITSSFSNHLLIIGYGFTGRSLASVARLAGVDFLIIDINPDTVRREKSNVPIIFGDATRESVLKKAGIHEAKVVVVAIPDPIATRRITGLAKKMAPLTTLIVRNRFLSHHSPIKMLGADEVITEEFESALGVLRCVMEHLSIPHDKIEAFLRKIRSDNFQFFSASHQVSYEMCDINSVMPDMEVRLWTYPGSSGMGESTIEQLDFRKRFGLTILGVKRGEEIYPNPSGGQVLKGGDVLILLGGLEAFEGLYRSAHKNLDGPT